ncbi:MAG: efflux RND transporter permease subunit [Acidobacteriota bacterium]
MISILLSVLIAFIPFRYLGISANIMSLGGIAIAVGALVDAAIVMVEQVHKRLEEQGESTGRRRVIVDAAKQVAGPSFFALLVIAVALLPLLTLESQEGRLFRPMAYATSLSLTIAAVLAITLGPALLVLLFDKRGRIQREGRSSAYAARDSFL